MTRRLLDRRRKPGRNATASKAELAKIERDVELWYARHDEAGGDAEKEAAWRRIVQLTEKKKALQQQAPQQEDVFRPSKAITREQIKTYLEGLTSLVGNAEDRGRAMVLSLVEHQGLKVRMVDERTISITMTLLPPDPSAERVKLQATVTIPTGNAIDVWLEEQNARKLTCACGCGRRIEVRRTHYWRGVPKLHGACRQKAMQAKRASITGDRYVNGTQLARRLGIGLTTLRRWVKAGKLPQPERGISGMLLFGRAQVMAAPST